MRGAAVRALILAVMLAGLGAPAASAQSMEERLPVCLACHGEHGRSETAEVPSLGGQPEFYLIIQLYMFREKLRVVDIMNEATRGLRDDDLRKMATTLARLPPPVPSAPPDPARAERAREVIQQNRCNFCHDGNFAGQQNVPRLAGQREDYLAKAMREYKNNSRRGYDASMADVMYAVGEDQIEDLAHFLSHVR
jgi:cytochrome c553